HHAGYPALDLLRQDRVLHRARGLSDVFRPHRRRGDLQLPRNLCCRPHRVLADGARDRAGRAGPGTARGHRGHGDPARSPIPEGPGIVSILKTEQLTKSFGDTHAVDHVDFTVTEGEVLALIGSNGAGKTTLVNLISGLIPADSGRIVLEGTDITAASVHRKIELGIARSFQLVNLFAPLSTLDNVALAIFSRDGKTRKLLSLSESDTAVRDEARGILQSFGLGEKAAMVAGGLSQGERKLLDVAVAYALRPKLLFLDKPTSGGSTREKAPIMDIITSVVRSGGITAVIIEHDMDVVFTYCPRIVAMHQGAILADGTPDQIRNHPQVTANLLGAQPA